MRKMCECLDSEPVIVDAPQKKNTAIKVFAVIGVIVAVAGIVFALYKYFKPDYLEDLEDEFEDFEDEI